MSETTAIIPDFPQRYRLERAMEVGNVDVDDLARELDVHRNTILNYIAGRTRPTRAVLLAVESLTGVPVWWLEGKNGPDDDPVVVRIDRRRKRQEVHTGTPTGRKALRLLAA